MHEGSTYTTGQGTTSDVQSCHICVYLLCLDGQLDSPVSFPLYATRLWDLLLTAMVKVKATVSALGPLVEEAIEHTTAMVAPRRMVVVTWC